MNDSILIFNECHNKQLLLASVTIHAEYTIHTPTQLGHHYCRYFSFPSDQTKLGTDLAGFTYTIQLITVSKIFTTQFYMWFYILHMNLPDTQHLLDSPFFYQHLADHGFSFSLFFSSWGKALTSFTVVAVWFPGKLRKVIIFPPTR